MPKLDKSLYTKEQYKQLKQDKKLKKMQERSQKVAGAKTAYVIGNGTSRRGINIKGLSKHGVVYGCNAIYRDCTPDFLIAVDVKMILEINKSGYSKNHQVWTNYNKAYENFDHLNYFKPSKGWSSGPTALWMATQQGYDVIYILGFDYQGLQNGTKFNNMFADSDNYKRSTDGATFYGNWLRQTKTVIEQNPKVQFVRVVDHDTFMPPELDKFRNLVIMKKDVFLNIHPGM